jgi:hypothetical protein
MQNDRELTRDRNLGLAKPVALGEPGPPRFQRGPFWDAGQQNAGCFEYPNSFLGLLVIANRNHLHDLAALRTRLSFRFLCFPFDAFRERLYGLQGCAAVEANAEIRRLKISS